jgi:ankyrin repeat protein
VTPTGKTTDLFQAATAGDSEAIQALIAASADVNDIDEKDRTPLILAAANGRVDSVRTLLAHGADVEAVAWYERTALTAAAEAGHTAVVALLLDQFLEPEARALQAVEALHASAGEGRRQTVRFLLRSGVPVDARQKGWGGQPGRTPLMTAASQGRVMVAEELLRAGAEIAARDGEGDTALARAVIGKHLAVTRLLLAWGADAQEFDDTPQPLLLLAGAHVRLIQALLAAGAGTRGRSRHSLLGSFAASSNLRLVEILLEAGADPNARHEAHRTALMQAAFSGSRAIVQRLIAAGAELELRDQFGNTALMLAAERRRVAISRLLREAGATDPCPAWEELRAAVRKGTIEALRQAITAGAHVNLPDSSGKTALMHAAEVGNLAMLKVLLSAGGDVQRTDARDKTAILYAVATGDLEIVAALLDAGADPDAQAADGSTALILAAGEGRTDICQRLLAAGASVDRFGEPGITASHVRGTLGKSEWLTFQPLSAVMRAAAAGHLETVRLLIASGADVNARDAVGNTALLQAAWGGHWPVVEGLREAGALIDDRNRDFLKALDFPERARQPGFQEAAEHVAALCRSAPRPVEETPGAVCFELPFQGRYEALLPEWEDEFKAEWEARHQISAEIEERASDFCRQRDCHLIRSHFRDDGYTLVLLPAPDKYAVIAAFGTEAVNYNLDTTAIMNWLRELERVHPFHLTGCSSDMIEGRFLTAVQDAESLARRMEDFCPDLVGQVVDSLEEVVGVLAERRFHFWWD